MTYYYLIKSIISLELWEGEGPFAETTQIRFIQCLCGGPYGLPTKGQIIPKTRLFRKDTFLFESPAKQEVIEEALLHVL